MAITSNSTLKDIMADDRAVALVTEFLPGFIDNTEAIRPVMGMKFAMLIKFPQAGIPVDTQKALCAKLDALDA